MTQIRQCTLLDVDSFNKLIAKKTDIMEEKYIEAPIITTDGENLTVHNYINEKGKMTLNVFEAHLLLLELYKFVNKKK